MKTYIFDFEAIPIAEAVRYDGAKGQWPVGAIDFKEANERAEEYFKTNEQFRFEYRLSCIDV